MFSVLCASFVAHVLGPIHVFLCTSYRCKFSGRALGACFPGQVLCASFSVRLYLRKLLCASFLQASFSRRRVTPNASTTKSCKTGLQKVVQEPPKKSPPCVDADHTNPRKGLRAHIKKTNVDSVSNLWTPTTTSHQNKIGCTGTAPSPQFSHVERSRGNRFNRTSPRLLHVDYLLSLFRLVGLQGSASVRARCKHVALYAS